MTDSKSVVPTKWYKLLSELAKAAGKDPVLSQPIDRASFRDIEFYGQKPNAYAVAKWLENNGEKEAAKALLDEIDERSREIRQLRARLQALEGGAAREKSGREGDRAGIGGSTLAGPSVPSPPNSPCKAGADFPCGFYPLYCGCSRKA